MFNTCLTSTEEYEATDFNKQLEDCITKIGQKETHFMKQLYEMTSKSIYSFALSILRNCHDAEDVLQDCYLSIYQSADTYRSSGKPLAWILTITRNLCLKRFRLISRQDDIPQDELETYYEERPEMSQIDKMIIRECLNSLSEDERQIIVLHAVSGFKHKEIAEFLNMPISTVLSKYSRSIEKLKKIYEGEKK